MRTFLILVGLLLLAGCSQPNLNEQHKQYFSKKGWEIKELTEDKTYILDIPNELLSSYKASGITFFGDYLGEEVTRYSYELKEKDIEGKHLQAEVFEVEGKIIGGFGVLPSWTPGRFNLNDKERLMKEKMIKQ